MLLSRRILSVFLFVICVTPREMEAGEWPVARGASREPEPFVFNRDMLKKVPAAFMNDYPAFYIRAGSWHLIEEDGTVETVTHEIIYVNNRKGIEQIGEYRNISFRPDYEILTVNELRLLKADGQQVAIEPSHLQLRDVHTDYYVYDASRELIVSTPGLEVGDALEVKWTTRGKHPEYAGHFFTRYQFGDDRYPVWQESFGARVPKKMTLKTALINPHLLPGKHLDPDIVEKDGSRTYVWHVKERMPIDKEELLPSKEELRPGVAISTFATWEEVATWERSIRSDCWQCTPELKKVVARIKQDHPHPQAIARELTEWFRNNIRYVSSGDKHDFTPHTPARVFKNGYGDCKDGVQLLASLLKEAGIASALVSLSPLGDGQIIEDLPSPLTTHALLLVVIEGKEHWIDTTLSHGGWDFLPRADCDRVAYLVDDKAIRVTRTPKFTPANNRTEMTTQVKVASDGSSHNVREMQFHGEAALQKRDEWIDVSTKERRRLIRTGLLENNGKIHLAKTIDIDEASLRHLNGPVKAKIEFEQPQHFQGAAEMEGTIADNTLWANLLNVTVDPERTMPIDLKEPFESRQTFDIAAPPGYRLVKPPGDREHSSNWGRFKRKIVAQESGRRWTVEFHTVIDETRIETDDFDDFLLFQENITSHHRVTISLKPVTEDDDVRTDIQELSDLAKQQPHDRDLQAELAQLYLRLGQKQEAGKIIKEALKAHPEDRTLLELATEAAEGIKEIEAAYGDLIKHFPEQRKYSLELARKLIDAKGFQKARKVLRAAQQGSPSVIKAESLLLLGRISFEEKKASEALKLLNEARLADADAIDNHEGHCLFGVVNEALDNSEEALAEFQEALEIDEKDVEALEGIIRILIKDEEKVRALKFLRRYVASIDQEGDPMKAARWYYQLDRLDDAEDMMRLEPAKTIKDSDTSIRGLIDFKRGRWEKAITNLERSVPLDAEKCNALMTGNLMLGKAAEAIEWAEKAEALKNIPSKLKELALAVKKLKQRREGIQKNSPPADRDRSLSAIDLFVCAEFLHETASSSANIESLLEKALARPFKLGPAVALRAESMIEKGNLTKALIDAENAIEMSPMEARGYFVRGRIRFERSQYDAARTDLFKAVELSGEKNPRHLHWLASALLATGEPAEALKYQEKAAELLPRDSEIKEQLLRIKSVIDKK